MHSLLLLALVACLLAVPGIAASLAAFPPGEVSIVTRSAAAFGLGYAASGGVAFLLAAAHAFRLSLFIPLWVAVSAVLWVLALRRASLRDHAHALVDDIDKNRLPLLLGALVIAVYLILHLKFLHLLGASRYVYYLSGIEIANSGGVPSSTLEYGQSWPPATDKAFLDAFTGVLVLLDRNVAIGPGVLLLVSILGSALGLWATAWELGLRRTSAAAGGCRSADRCGGGDEVLPCLVLWPIAIAVFEGRTTAPVRSSASSRGGQLVGDEPTIHHRRAFALGDILYL